jgi:divalent metal cation (Fe/Co/Zn/Cd) transporter
MGKVYRNKFWIRSLAWELSKNRSKARQGKMRRPEARAPEHSIFGIILACVSLVVMPLLSRSKRKVGHALNSAAMHADAEQTQFCTYLSMILLVGLILNAAFGLWWADPIAALIMVPIIAKEGFGGLQGKTCDDCATK